MEKLQTAGKDEDIKLKQMRSLYLRKILCVAMRVCYLDTRILSFHTSVAHRMETGELLMPVSKCYVQRFKTIFVNLSTSRKTECLLVSGENNVNTQEFSQGQFCVLCRHRSHLSSTINQAPVKSRSTCRHTG